MFWIIKTDFGAKENAKESVHNARTAEKKPMTSKYGSNLEDVCTYLPYHFRMTKLQTNIFTVTHLPFLFFVVAHLYFADSGLL